MIISCLFGFPTEMYFSEMYPRWHYWWRPHLPVQETRETGFDPWVRKIPWRRKWQPTPVLLSGESHGQRSLGATVHGATKSRRQLSDEHTHWNELGNSYVPTAGEGNGTPLQHSCLENPMDGGAWSLVSCSPWGREESDTTERLHFHFSLSCLGEGNGNPLQCSCLENPRDAGAWWAAIYGVAQSRTRLKWLSNSSSSMFP